MHRRCGCLKCLSYLRPCSPSPSSSSHFPPSEPFFVFCFVYLPFVPRLFPTRMVIVSRSKLSRLAYLRCMSKCGKCPARISSNALKIFGLVQRFGSSVSLISYILRSVGLFLISCAQGHILFVCLVIMLPFFFFLSYSHSARLFSSCMLILFHWRVDIPQQLELIQTELNAITVMFAACCLYNPCATQERGVLLFFSPMLPISFSSPRQRLLEIRNSHNSLTVSYQALAKTSFVSAKCHLSIVQHRNTLSQQPKNARYARRSRSRNLSLDLNPNPLSVARRHLERKQISIVPH